MSALEDYDKRLNRTPLEPVETERTICCWLHDRQQAVYAALENPKAPVGVGFRCSYCWNAAGRTEEAWQTLPKVDYDDAVLHAQVCEHNPLVQSIARISHDRDAALAELEELRGRKIGKADTWAEAASEAIGMYDYQRKLHEAMKATIRSLLTTELPAGELRKAIAELVR